MATKNGKKKHAGETKVPHQWKARPAEGAAHTDHPAFGLKLPAPGQWALVIIMVPAEDTVFCSSTPPDSCVRGWRKLPLDCYQRAGLTREC